MYMNELYHYGIKGMKWGVRKKQNDYGKNLSNVTFKDYDLAVKGGYLPKGTILYRVTNSKDESKLKRKYMSFVKEDAETYSDSDYFRYKYLDSYKSTKKIKVAGLKEVMEAHIATAGKPKILDQKMSEVDIPYFSDISRKNYINKYGDVKLKDIMKKIENDEDYYWFLRDINLDKEINSFDKMENTKTNSEYFKYLRSKGYDAVIDATDTFWDTTYPIINLNDDKISKTKTDLLIDGNTYKSLRFDKDGNPYFEY